MDEQLAAIYGTGQVYEEEDLEKTAAAELLVKLAAEEGLDLNDFSDQEVAEMINELGGIEHTAGVDDEGQEKIAEADFLGRVMAHSMVQELDSIEKQAGRVGKALATAGEATGISGIIRGLKGRAALKESVESAAKWAKGKHPMSLAAQDLAKAQKLRAGATGEAVEGLKRFGKRVGVPAAIAAGGAGAYALGKKKKASAIDKLAEIRAYELLAEAGYEDGGQEKTALDQRVEVQALQMLEQAGYPVEWND